MPAGGLRRRPAGSDQPWPVPRPPTPRALPPPPESESASATPSYCGCRRGCRFDAGVGAAAVAGAGCCRSMCQIYSLSPPRLRATPLPAAAAAGGAGTRRRVSLSPRAGEFDVLAAAVGPVLRADICRAGPVLSPAMACCVSRRAGTVRAGQRAETRPSPRPCIPRTGLCRRNPVADD